MLAQERCRADAPLSDQEDVESQQGISFELPELCCAVDEKSLIGIEAGAGAADPAGACSHMLTVSFVS